MTVAFRPTLIDPPLQEIVYRQSHDPWRVAVACMLLNRTSRRQADLVWPILFRRWPVSGALAYQTEDGELEALLNLLGLANRRAHALQRMSHEWTVDPRHWRADDVSVYHGLGMYAQDSHRIFVCGHLGGLPEDRVLRAWIRLLRGLPAADRPLAYRSSAPAWLAAATAGG